MSIEFWFDCDRSLSWSQEELEAEIALWICPKLRGRAGSLNLSLYQSLTTHCLWQEVITLSKTAPFSRRPCWGGTWLWAISKEHFLICTHLSQLTCCLCCCSLFQPLSLPFMVLKCDKFFHALGLKELVVPWVTFWITFSTFSRFPMTGSTSVFKCQGSKVTSSKKPSLTTPKYTSTSVTSTTTPCVFPS